MSQNHSTILQNNTTTTRTTSLCSGVGGISRTPRLANQGISCHHLARSSTPSRSMFKALIPTAQSSIATQLAQGYGDQTQSPMTPRQGHTIGLKKNLLPKVKVSPGGSVYQMVGLRPIQLTRVCIHSPIAPGFPRPLLSGLQMDSHF
ncbi:hypothetical protein M408DRAFT_103850 [Serendipita vermifera MAFF 305830]|uniref:Uncharacterized protein n=1 Tax=Serendipita vermifera MAFF 305830 TaxID=933852 RepID=A0A0C3AQC9_SERVB|nr:hypothetical protein M408DRAFT_103850 [Serendipita vermifera MAFF 305830]